MQTEKIIGKRKVKTVYSYKEINNLLILTQKLREGKPFYKKGVYKFKTFEENQICALKAMTGQNIQEFQQ
ncbi:MAG: hypothetical protein JW917_05850 [Ignavibacteria bacterium]|nr:hypothetical protein [Ignavibacteria bacterium]